MGVKEVAPIFQLTHDIPNGGWRDTEAEAAGYCLTPGRLGGLYIGMYYCLQNAQLALGQLVWTGHGGNLEAPHQGEK
jgi:hypothetical protein